LGETPFKLFLGEKMANSMNDGLDQLAADAVSGNIIKDLSVGIELAIGSGKA